MRLPGALPLCLALAALTGCGGGAALQNYGPPVTPGTRLVYTNPGLQATGYLLVRDAASTDQALVLDLVHTSPAGAAVGITFSFTVDTTRATWNASPILVNGNVFAQGAGGVQLARGWISGKQIEGIVSNKGLTGSVPDVSLAGAGILARIQLNLAPSPATGTVALADSGLSTVLGPLGDITPIQVQVGTLSVQ